MSECETIVYQAVVNYQAGGTCAFEGGTITIKTPDGQNHDVTPAGGVPCLGPDDGGTGTCNGTTSVSSQKLTYVVTGAGLQSALVNYKSSIVHDNEPDTTDPNLQSTAGTSASRNATSCPTDTDCIDNFCNAAKTDGIRTGLCDSSNIPDSTPCTDSDGNACTTAGCEAGACVQTHVTKTCDPTNNSCLENPVCDPADGQCKSANKPDSTPCPDGDGNACTQAGCEAGSCVQTHTTTTCPGSASDCKQAPVCNPGSGQCEQANKPDSTGCTDSDGNACTTAGCEAGSCVQTHTTKTCPGSASDCKEAPVCNPSNGNCDQANKPNSTACTDSDQESCTTAGCEAGECVQTHVNNCNPEICRTPGFFGTHAGTEKKNSQNITQAIIDAAGGCIVVCGEKITNTKVNDADSALEAICSGGGSNQLARQLTAAALNCLLTNGNADCSNVSVGPVWQACDAACVAGKTTADVNGTTVNCIEAIDSFNNGTSVPGQNCHNQPLNPNALDLNLKEGPAGSSNACSAANASSCTLVPKGESACGSGLECAAPETCGQTQC